MNIEVCRATCKAEASPIDLRALAVVAAGSRLYCIGGMDSNDEPTLSVGIYDTTSG